jgi:hypothetical protein
LGFFAEGGYTTIAKPFIPVFGFQVTSPGFLHYLCGGMTSVCATGPYDGIGHVDVWWQPELAVDIDANPPYYGPYSASGVFRLEVTASIIDPVGAPAVPEPSMFVPLALSLSAGLLLLRRQRPPAAGL